jgi:uncharacterized protein (DUF1810 family)
MTGRIPAARSAYDRVMSTSDPFNLFRFVAAQEGVIETALAELAAGRKRGHWMWFVFPQLTALGQSGTAKFYGMSSLAEAQAYLEHALLGPRLGQATAAATASSAVSAHELFGSPDDLKFRSSMTLFARVQPDGPWVAALARFGLDPDPATLELLKETPPG